MVRTTTFAACLALAALSVGDAPARAGGAPAAAADVSFCGLPGGEPDAVRAAIAKTAGMKEIYRGAEYVAYQDATSEAVFSFTEAGQGAAHPSAICRKPVKVGDNLTLQMVIICKGLTDACQALESDFKLLNAKMEAAIRNQAGEAPGKQ